MGLHPPKDLRERFALAADLSPAGMVLADASGTIVAVNRRLESLLGYAPGELDGRSVEILVPERFRERHPAEREAFAAAPTPRLMGAGRDLYARRKDGTELPVEVALNPERAAGRAYVIATVVDISARKAAERALHESEERLRRSQKLEAIGTLAGGIAHDFNNILGAIVGYAELARDAARDAPGVAADVDQILRAADRGRRLVSRIMTFGRRREQVRVPTNLAEPLGEALELLRASVPSTIAIRHRFDPETPPVLADATQIHQVVMNLVTNAAQALGAAPGTIEVALEPLRGGEELAARHPGLSAGAYALLSVTDTGCGMPPEVLDRVFEPFFTTKGPGEGTGLGLSVVHGIVEGHAGAIEVRSAVGRGTTVTICLPGIEAEAVRHERATAEPPAGHGERILVVDDESVLAELTRRHLERFGYRVTTATSSDDALAAFERDPSAFDLVVTDNTMPKLTGVALAERLVAIRPEIPVILVTGLGEIAPAAELREAGIRRLLVKPVASRALGTAVAEVLADAS